jgi:hypothetical protein
MATLYEYVGPAAIRARCADGPLGCLVSTPADLLAWVDDGEVRAVTFVVDADGNLRIADRHSEHVACAGGGPVRSAGELFLRRAGDSVEVAEASNQSTGYCPEPESWPAVAAALDAAGIGHPGCFTTAILFRRCPGCGERSIVKDAWFVCPLCGADLPAAWNFTSRS